MPKRPKETIPTDLRTFRQAAMLNRPFAEKMLAQCPDLVRERDSRGETALHYCAIEDSKEAVVWLISKDALVNTHDHTNSTPLIRAAQLGHLKVCKVLLNAGADLTATDIIESDTALHAAARFGHAEVCQLLLDAGASVNSTNENGERPWDIALPRKKALIHEVLRKHGGSPSSPKT